MNLTKALRLLSLSFFILTTTGCAVNRSSANVDANVNLDRLKTMHVVQTHNESRAVDTLIADKLRSKGLVVSTGEKPKSEVDALVTYVDKWVWDFTIYMLELTVTIRDPKTNYPLASGNSFHTSLTRLSPEEMVNEVIENIMKEGKSK